ncbi:type II toxin-antitoxin system VapC family toxin [Candidatus Gottesmanbacteria bacterium]|nr:type II toxin-antitoxin system VapC family toxin [Candidatus Gottesmanbacteria bacterium]MBI5452859.1 type II toxin-antitoxin system VapC family toxin [Candidatus Gottesmanbacteria bacterium]
MIVLDTHVLVWWLGLPDKLSPKAKRRIDGALSKNEILISSISIWEIYLLVKRGRLKLTMDIDTWMERVEALPFIRFVPVDNKIAAKSVSLPPPLHNDPADRMIIATALQENAVLITSDKRILKYHYVQTLW